MARGIEVETHPVFITYGRTRAAPASERRDLIRERGWAKVFTLDLVVPFVQKRDADGNPTRKKARIIAGDLVPGGRS